VFKREALTASFSWTGVPKILTAFQRFWKGRVMEDFPVWLKMTIWLIVGGTVLYALGAMVYYNFLN